MLHSKFWQGFFAIVPLLALFAMLGAYFFFVYDLIVSAEAWEASGQDPTASEVFSMMTPFFIGIIILSILSLGSFVFYLAHAIQNPNLKSDMRVIYIVLFVIMGGISQLVYWLVECQGKRGQTAKAV